MWAIESSGVAPDLLVSGKSLGGGLPLAAVTGRAEVMDAPGPGGLGTFGGNPVACAAAAVVLDTVAAPEFRARADELGTMLRARLDEARRPARRDRRGPRAWADARARARGAEPDLAHRITAAAFERPAPALVRPLRERAAAAAADTVTDDELDRGLTMLEESLAAATEIDVRVAGLSATATSPPSTGSTSRFSAASSSRCSAPRVPARRRRSG